MAEKVVRLAPGDQVSYPPPAPAATSLVPKARTTPSPTTAAAQEPESFDDVPAAEIAAKVNVSSALKIVFADPALGARKVVADFNTSDAQAVAQKLASLLGLIIDRSQPDRLLLRRPS
jgi:transmembrane sensor